MICCVVGLSTVGFLLAARFVRTRLLGAEEPPDPADWRLFPESH